MFLSKFVFNEFPQSFSSRETILEAINEIEFTFFYLRTLHRVY